MHEAWYRRRPESKMLVPMNYIHNWLVLSICFLVWILSEILIIIDPWICLVWGVLNLPDEGFADRAGNWGTRSMRWWINCDNTRPILVIPPISVISTFVRTVTGKSYGKPRENPSCHFSNLGKVSMLHGLIQSKTDLKKTEAGGVEKSGYREVIRT